MAATLIHNQLCCNSKRNTVQNLQKRISNVHVSVWNPSISVSRSLGMLILTARGKPRAANVARAAALTSPSAVITFWTEPWKFLMDQVLMIVVPAMPANMVMLLITQTILGVNFRHIGSISKEVIISTT